MDAKLKSNKTETVLKSSDYTLWVFFLVFCTAILMLKDWDSQDEF